MKLFTQEIRDRLRNHGHIQAPLKGTDREIDFFPVVKIFAVAGAATWLLTEIEPDSDRAFGLCDLGFGSPELGYVSLTELESVKDKLGLPLERDLHFTAEYPLSVYTAAAVKAGRIVTDRASLEAAAQDLQG